MKGTYLIASLLILASCNTESENVVQSNQEDTTRVIDLGDSLSMIAQQTLLGNVGIAMQNGGPDNAIDFCNIHATPIMDSLSTAHDVSFNRVSRKNRNPLNATNEFEKGLLQEMEVNKLKDTLVVNESNYVYYKSIKIGMPTCLKCHGSSNEIEKSTADLLTARYPNDKATNYKLGDFRGAWKIELPKN